MEDDIFSRKFRQLAETRTEVTPATAAGSDGGEIRLFNLPVNMFENAILKRAGEIVTKMGEAAELEIAKIYPVKIVTATNAMRDIVVDAIEPNRPKLEYIIMEVPQPDGLYPQEVISRAIELSVTNPFPEGSALNDAYTDRMLEMLELRRNYAEKLEIPVSRVIVVDRALMAISYWADPDKHSNNNVIFNAYLAAFNLEFEKITHAVAMQHNVLPQEIAASIRTELDSMFPPSEEDTK
jgi:hypothetical protein